jgi:gamma-glutamyltranspeptidase/glutathione hydrolase
MLNATQVPQWVRARAARAWATRSTTVQRLTSGPINAIYVDREHGTFWGGSSNYGEDYGIAW